MTWHKLAVLPRRRRQQTRRNAGAARWLQTTAPLRSGQNIGNLQIVVDWLPSTSKAYQRLTTALRAYGLRERLVRVAERLGGRREMGQSSRAEIRYRIAYANAAGSAHSRWWGDAAVCWPLR